MAEAFHDIRFPLDIALGSSGGPERRTDIVTLASGHERRNARWAHSRRRYDAGYGVKTLNELHAVLAFFEERRGMLTGFRWRDRADFKSCAPGQTPTALDQTIGTGDGVTAAFQLRKRYGAAFAPYDRPILKPVAGTVLVAVNGVVKLLGSDADLETTTGIVTFRPSAIPAAGQSITAGFEFDVPVRFDTDRLDIDLSAFAAGAIPKIPLIEILV
jgi:uncharacterized protein (TIGR02217 family)